MTIAPWLHPINFVAAAQAGAASGLGIRRANQEATEAADRLQLAYDSLASNERRSNEATQERMAVAKASLALRGQQMDAVRAYHENQIDARNREIDNTAAYREGALDARNRQVDNSQSYQNASLALRQKAADARAQGKEYGEPEFFDIPGLPGSKGVYRKGSPGLHVVNPPRAAATSGLEVQRLRAAAGLPKMIAQLADMDPNSPEYSAGTNAVAMVKDFLKSTTPAPAAAATAPGKKQATHRYDAKTGKIVPISASNSPSAALLPDRTDDAVDDNAAAALESDDEDLDQ